MRSGMVIGFVALLAAGPGLAQGRVGPEVNCMNPQGTPEISYCAAGDFKRADTRLNSAYRAMLARIDTGGDFEGKAKAGLKAAIQDAQRKWIAFRDADCNQAVGLEWGSGTGGPYAIYTCLTEKTLVRAKELDARPH